MGFLYHAIPITFFLSIFANARFLFFTALTHLGLYKPPPDETATSRDNSNNYILILDTSSPSLVPIHVHVVTSAIKNRVPIVQFKDLILGPEKDEQKGCSICLECIELCDEVRELSDCRHVFHRACLDTWIDEGQITCPLCRSMLLSPKAILSARCKVVNPDRVVQNDDAHLGVPN